MTECLGGSMELTEEELGLRYQSFCDPRLNFEQSLGTLAPLLDLRPKPTDCRLDVAFIISEFFKNQRQGNGHTGGVLLSELGKRV